MYYKIIISFSLIIINIHYSNCKEAPKLSTFHPKHDITEGFPFRLLCQTSSGTNPVFYQWNKNGLTLANNPESNYKIETYEDHSQFIIKSVDRSDAANYSCIARNAFGTDIQTVVLFVKVAPIWVKEPKDIRVNAGDDVIVECVADGLPKPTIKWISSKGNVIESEVLNIGKFTTSTDTYECIADNGIGDSLRKVIHIYFSVPAKFDEKYSLIQVKRGESAIIKCNASGDQPF